MAEEFETYAARLDEVRRMVEAWDTEGGAQRSDEGRSDAVWAPEDPVDEPDEQVTPHR